MQRLRVDRLIFDFFTSPLRLFFWFPGRAYPQANKRLFCEWRVRMAYSIATPVKVSSGVRSGLAGAMRLRTICIAAPQHGHSKGGRTFIQVCGGMGVSFNTHCSNAISRLLLGCRKPKLRARRKPLGRTCCMSSHKKVAPLTVRVAALSH